MDASLGPGPSAWGQVEDDSARLRSLDDLPVPFRPLYDGSFRWAGAGWLLAAQRAPAPASGALRRAAAGWGCVRRRSGYLLQPAELPPLPSLPQLPWHCHRLCRRPPPSKQQHHPLVRSPARSHARSYFNAIQSEVFHDVAESAVNLVLAAPTGSGKTVVMELAVLQLLARHLDGAGCFHHRPGEAALLRPPASAPQMHASTWAQGIACTHQRPLP